MRVNISNQVPSDLFEEFIAKKRQADELNKQVEELKSKIKDKLLDMDDFTFVTESGKVVYLSERTSVSLDEGRLIQKLKEMDLTMPIKTKEFIDKAVLEDVVFSGELPAKVAKEYITEKKTYAVMVKGLKRDEN